MKFREHRGTLGDSMETVVELADTAALADHIDRLGLLGVGRITTYRLEIEPYGGRDDRIGWPDVHLISIKGWGPVGFIDRSPYP